jgi:hypothetical protein
MTEIIELSLKLCFIIIIIIIIMVNKEDNIMFFINKISNYIYIIDIMIYLIKMSSILMLY